MANAQAKAAEAEKLKERLGEANEKAKKLYTEVEEVKNEILNAKIDEVAEYK